MVAFDVPHVANDMMTRFMGVEFALLPGLLASSGSKVGDNERMAIGTGSSASAGVPLFKGGGTDWEGQSQPHIDGVCREGVKLTLWVLQRGIMPGRPCSSF
jgi:hypothetical protein